MAAGGIARALTGAAVLAALLCLAGTGFAQQRVVPPRASPLSGRPDTEGAMRLVPPVPPAQPTPVDKLPLAQLRVPRGFRIEVYAAGVAGARSLRVGDKGAVFAGSTLGFVYAVVSKDGRGEVKVVASGLNRPSGLAYKDDTLYIAELSRIVKIEHVEDNLDDPPPPVAVYEDLPKEETNALRFIGIGPDDRLYVSVGMPCNNCLAPDGYGQIRRMILDGSGAEVLAEGLRFSLGFDWNPANRDLYFTDNGRDWLSEELPNDELNRATRPGQNFGAPYCYDDVPDQVYGWGRACSEFVRAGRQARPAYRAARHAVLHRHHVSGGLPGRDLRRPPRLLEQDGEDRRRRGRGQAQPRRQRAGGRAVPHRLHRRQCLSRPAGRRRDDEGRLAARLRRLEWRDLPGDLRQRAAGASVKTAAAPEIGGGPAVCPPDPLNKSAGL